MKHLRLYENFQNDQEISDICQKYHIEDWIINSEGLVDVYGDVDLENKKLDKLPLKFGRVTGKFDCGINNLTSLDGAPKQVGSYFFCNKNKLTSLEGSPKYVGGHFNCSDNELVGLEGGPKHVGGNFYCNHNKLTGLEGAPDFVGYYFYCLNNPIYNIWKLFQDYSKIELFNYYDIIRDLNDEPAIVLARLNQFLDDISKPPVKNIDGYINI